MRLRHVADLNPSVAGLDPARAGDVVTFLPLETIWADDRFDVSRTIEFEGSVGSYNPVADGDILLPKVSPTFAAGRAAVATGLVGGRALATSEVFVLRAHEAASARFLAYRLRARDVIGEGVASWTGVAGLKRVSTDFVKDVQIDPGGWLRRYAIADFLDHECERIACVAATRRRLAADLREPSLTMAAREFDAQPAGRIGYAFDVQLGKMLDGARVDADDTRPYLRNANVQWDEIRLHDVKEMTFSHAERRFFALRRGDLLVCEGGDPGRAAVWSSELDECYFQKALHRLRPVRGASSRYLLHALRVLSLRGAFTSDGPGRYTHLTAEELRATRVPMPAEDEQHRRAAELDELASKATAAEHALDVLDTRLAEYREALINEAVTGRLDVRAVSDTQMNERAHAAAETGATIH